MAIDNSISRQRSLSSDEPPLRRETWRNPQQERSSHFGNSSTAARHNLCIFHISPFLSKPLSENAEKLKTLTVDRSAVAAPSRQTRHKPPNAPQRTADDRLAFCAIKDSISMGNSKLRSTGQAFLFALASCAFLPGCGKQAEKPIEASLPADDQLRDRLDHALEFTYTKRHLNTTDQAAWQIVHGRWCMGAIFRSIMTASSSRPSIICWAVASCAVGRCAKAITG